MATIILIHGLGAHSGRWAELKTLLTKKGYSVKAPDFPQNTRTVLNYLTTTLDIQKNKPTILIGESLGGLMTAYAATKLKNIQGIILLSPAFGNVLKFNLLEYLGIIFGVSIKGHFSAEMLTQDKSWIQKIRENKKETRTFKGTYWLSIAYIQILSYFFIKKIHCPTLMLLAGKDYLVNNSKTLSLFERLPSKNKKYIMYPTLRHALSIERERSMVYKDMLQWLKQF